MRHQQFSTFWHGAELSPMHWACLSSFVERGHALTVFSYEDVRLPKGVVRADAGQICPREAIFEFRESFSAFSNLFRYKLLLEQGGWWVDTDVYCLKEDIPECTYAWAKQDNKVINGAILKFPAGNPTLEAILNAALKIGQHVEVWGQIGPRLLTEHLSGREFDGHYGSRKAFYPVHWLETHVFWLPDGKALVLSRCADSCFVHLWGSTFKAFGIDLMAAPPKGSFLHDIYDRSAIHRTLPPSDEAKTRASIKAHLAEEWVKERAESLLGYDVSGTVTS